MKEQWEPCISPKIHCSSGKVALKTPTFDDDANGELLKRFYREARAVAILKHPNLCAVYDVGEIDGRHYISMEFVAGRKLQEFIKPDQPLSEKQAMAAVRKIALAMQEAHALGVIHRDLKPDNIMVNEKGDPVVMDFGLVHKTERKSSTKITKHGTLVGSPAYMSKEQVEGDPDKLTAATDQYSLGVILYQLLTSKLPFEGGIHALLGAILTKEPLPPSHYRPDLNPHLEAVCLKMMAKEAGDRYPSMKAATDALAEVVRGTSTAGGSSVPARPTEGSPSDASLETTLDFSPAHFPSPTAEFDIHSLIEQPSQDTGVLRRFASLSPNSVLYGNLAAGLAVLFAVAFWMRSGDSLVKVEVHSVGFEVTFKEAGITVKAGLHEANVKPGDHTLHIQSDQSNNSPASEGFDTEQFSLTRGDKPVVTVKLENAGIVARLNGKVILRRSLLPSDLVSQSNGTVGRAAVLDSAMIDVPAERERTPANSPQCRSSRLRTFKGAERGLTAESSRARSSSHCSPVNAGCWDGFRSCFESPGPFHCHGRQDTGCSSCVRSQARRPAERRQTRETADRRASFQLGVERRQHEDCDGDRAG